MTVKSRVLSPEFRGRMVSSRFEFLNLLFVGVKVLLLYFVINMLQKKTANVASLAFNSLKFWNQLIYIFSFSSFSLAMHIEPLIPSYNIYTRSQIYFFEF